MGNEIMSLRATRRKARTNETLESGQTPIDAREGQIEARRQEM